MVPQMRTIVSQDMNVLVFGELLLRLDTPEHERFVQAESLNVSFTGGEANVAVALSQWNVNTSIASCVPTSDIGDACVNHLRRYGVNTDPVIRSGERLGILFVETGAGQRGSSVIYDRQNTSFRELKAGDLDWNSVLSEKSWLHFTGTALVSPGGKELLLEGLNIANQLGIGISFDVSYRSKLWSVNEARTAFLEVMPFVNVLIGSEQDASVFFAIEETGDDALTALASKYDLKWTAFTTRQIDDLGVNFYSAKLFDRKSVHQSPVYPTASVDRIGTGDAFAAGLIYKIMKQSTAVDILSYATAAAVLKHSIPGDFALLKPQEIEALIDGHGIGKVRR